MAIKNLDHASILAKDPQPVIDFYRDNLGFELVGQREIKKMHMKIFDMKKGGDKLEIIQPTSTDIRMSDGLKHLAFISDNIQGDFEKFQKSGSKMLHKKVQEQEGVSFFFAQSPSGEFVEIIQYQE